MSIIEYYEEEPITFLEHNGKRWISGPSIAKGLGVNRNIINQIFNRHKDEFSGFVDTFKMKVRNRPIETRIFDESGFILICMFSKSPKAKLFRKWAVEVLRQVKSKGYYIENHNEMKSLINLLNDLVDQNKLQIMALTKTYALAVHNSKQIQQSTQQLESYIEHQKNGIPITDKTFYEIRKLIHQYKMKHGDYIWLHLKAKFDFSKLKRLTEIRGIEILKYLQKIT